MPKVDSFVLMTVEVEGVDDCKKKKKEEKNEIKVADMLWYN